MIKVDFGVDIIYVLNLKRHKLRKQRILDLFKKHGIENYEFVEAIPGGQLPLDKERFFDYKKLINDGILNKWFADPNGLLTKNIIACAWSHLKIYEKFVKTDYETCLILEDDVIFSERIYEYILDGRFEQIKEDILEFDIGIFHWGKHQMDEIIGAKPVYNSPHHIFPRNMGPQSAQAYQLNKWTANHLIERGYPIKKAADVLLDHTKVKINCPQHSLFIQQNSPIKQIYYDRLGKAMWEELSEKEFRSETTPLNVELRNCFVENNIGIDTIRFRNYKTDDGALLQNYPILYFKE